MGRRRGWSSRWCIRWGRLSCLYKEIDHGVCDSYKWGSQYYELRQRLVQLGIPSRSSTWAWKVSSQSPRLLKIAAIWCVELYPGSSADIGCSKEERRAPTYNVPRATTCGGYCIGTSVLWLIEKLYCQLKLHLRYASYLSDAKRHASFVSFFVATSMVSKMPTVSFSMCVPLSTLPNLMTYGNDIREVKLKQIVSNTNRSTAKSRWRSCSTASNID